MDRRAKADELTDFTLLHWMIVGVQYKTSSLLCMICHAVLCMICHAGDVWVAYAMSLNKIHLSSRSSPCIPPICPRLLLHTQAYSPIVQVPTLDNHKSRCRQRSLRGCKSSLASHDYDSAA